MKYLTASQSQSPFKARCLSSRLPSSFGRRSVCSRAYSMITLRFSMINWAALGSPAEPAVEGFTMSKYCGNLHQEIKNQRYYHKLP